MVSLKTFQPRSTESLEESCTFRWQQKTSGTRLAEVSHESQSGELAYLADTGQHVDRWPEISNVKDRERELDVSVMPDAFRRLLPTCRTFTSLLIGSLYNISSLVVTEKLGLTMRGSRGPSLAVLLMFCSLV